MGLTHELSQALTSLDAKNGLAFENTKRTEQLVVFNNPICVLEMSAATPASKGACLECC
jgi:hypothetical protein